MSEASIYDEKKFDIRLIERHLAGSLKKASITDEELKAYLDSLPDVSEKSEPVTVVQPICEDADEDANK